MSSGFTNTIRNNCLIFTYSRERARFLNIRGKEKFAVQDTKPYI
jgi:hypothetical protein